MSHNHTTTPTSITVESRWRPRASTSPSCASNPMSAFTASRRELPTARTGKQRNRRRPPVPVGTVHGARGRCVRAGRLALPAPSATGTRRVQRTRHTLGVGDAPVLEASARFAVRTERPSCRRRVRGASRHDAGGSPGQSRWFCCQLGSEKPAAGGTCLWFCFSWMLVISDSFNQSVQAAGR